MPENVEYGKFQELIEGLFQEADQRAYDRHVMGSKEYGSLKFLEVDTIEYAIEEVLDLMNYMRFTYVKLRILQDFLAHKATEAESSDTTGGGFINTRNML